eukprot:5069309-Amphidinium_carterae.1
MLPTMLKAYDKVAKTSPKIRMQTRFKTSNAQQTTHLLLPWKVQTVQTAKAMLREQNLRKRVGHANFSIERQK